MAVVKIPSLYMQDSPRSHMACIYCIAEFTRSSDIGVYTFQSKIFRVYMDDESMLALYFSDNTFYPQFHL